MKKIRIKGRVEKSLYIFPAKENFLRVLIPEEYSDEKQLQEY